MANRVQLRDNRGRFVSRPNLFYARDGLLNAVSGIGTTADVRKSSSYSFTPLDQHAINSAYRGSGMMRKCIDIPALDMVRAWREWNAEGDDLEQIEKEETRLGLRQKIYEAEILRGLGGGAIIIGAPGEPSEPLGDIGIGQLAYLHVMSRYQITIGEMDKEPFSPNYGLPKWFTVNDGAQTRVDPSRIVCFTGDPIPQLSASIWEERFWGEARIQRLLNAVTNSDTAQDAFAALLHKAKLTRIGIEGLLDIVATADGERDVANRLSVMAVGESIHNVTIFDKGNVDGKGGETIDDYQVAWTGMSDVMSAFDKRLCAVADIPATRLLGESPGGLNASGVGQQQDWHKHVRAMQELRLRPCLDKIDRALVQSATGKKADMSNWYSFAPLDVPDEKALAETFKLKVEAAVKAQETGAIPDEAFAEGFQSMIVESGMMPALETALERVPEAERFGLAGSADPDGIDPNALTGGETNDAAPRTLYVQRKLLNGAELIKWAKSQGFTETLPADDLHVTITYSRQAVDWMKMGQSWGGANGQLRISPGGARLVEPLGDKGAVVLLFNSSELAWRHEAMVRAGASYDFDQYQSHVTICYKGAPDLANVEPYRGKLIFGPEIFEELDSELTGGTEAL